jgi:hypothetical protein
MEARVIVMHRIVLALLLVLFVMPTARAAGVDHSPWNELLQRHVVELRGGQATQVNYAGLRREHAQLTRYLAATSAVSRADFDRWAAPDQLAFLINAYNAWTVKLVLTGDPDLSSIRDLGSLLQSPWKKRFIPLLGETRSLDDIEHGLIRGSGRYREPRVHFAVNCASIGCPALRREAYVAAQLEAQLEDATRQFLGDRSRNHASGGRLQVSSIFKWYREDFESGWRRARNLGEFLALYGDALALDTTQRQKLAQGGTAIDFLDYDWRLNRAP